MLFRKPCLLLFLLLPLLAGAQTKDSSYAAAMRAPGVKMIAVDGKYKVWTQQVGKGKTRLLLLHGGPANTREYLGPEGVEIHFYDQLGSY